MIDDFYIMEQLLGENWLTKLSVQCTYYRLMDDEVPWKIYYVDDPPKTETKKYKKTIVMHYAEIEGGSGYKEEEDDEDGVDLLLVKEWVFSYFSSRLDLSLV